MTQFNQPETWKRTCTDWHSHRKLHYKHFRVFWCQSEDMYARGIEIKHLVNVMLLGEITSNGDVYAFTHAASDATHRPASSAWKRQSCPGSRG